MEEILQEIRELKQMMKFRTKVIVGSKEIATMMDSTPSSLRVSLKRLISEGYPIKKDGSRIVAVREDLEQFIKDRFAKL